MGSTGHCNGWTIRQGDRFAGYIVDDILGFTDSHFTCRVHPASGNGCFCLKMFRVPVADRSRILERWSQAVKFFGQRASHGLIIPHEIGEWEGGLYQVSIYVAGTGIDRACSTRLPSQSLVGLWIEALCLLLDKLHRCGIFHFNLKPSNVIIDPEGTFWLRDPIQLCAEEVGPFSPPEIFVPSDRVDPERAEVFGVGVVLYSLLTGSLAGWLTSDRKRRGWPYLIEPVALNRSVSSALEAVCLRALACDPAQRYPTVLALADDLMRAVRGESTAASPPSLWSRLTSLSWRWPGAVVVALAGLILGGGITGLSIYTVVDLQDDLWRARAELVEASSSLERKQEAMAWLRKAVTWRRPPQLRELAIKTVLLADIESIGQIQVEKVSEIVWSPSGRYLLLLNDTIEGQSGATGQCLVADRRTQRVVSRFAWNLLSGEPVFHPSEDWFLIPAPDGHTWLCSPLHSEPVGKIPVQGPMVFDPTGVKAAIGSKQVYVFNFVERRFVGRRDADGLIGWLDAQTVILRKGSGIEFWRPESQTASLLSPQQERLVAVSYDGLWSLWAFAEGTQPGTWYAVRLRRLPGGELVATLRGMMLPYLPYPARFDLLGRRLLIPDPQDRSVLRIFRLPSLEPESLVSIRGLVFDYRSRSRFVGGPSGYHWVEGEQLDEASPWRKVTCSLGVEGRFLAALTLQAQGGVEVWDLESGSRMGKLQHAGLPSWSLTGPQLAAVRRGDDGSSDYVELWQVQTPSPTLRLSGVIRHLRFGWPGTELGAENNLVRVEQLGKALSLERIGQVPVGGYLFPSINGSWWHVTEQFGQEEKGFRVSRYGETGRPITIPVRGRQSCISIPATGGFAFIADFQLDSGPLTNFVQGTLSVWSLDEGRLLSKVAIPEPLQPNFEIVASRSGRFLALTCEGRKELMLWQWDGQKLEPFFRIRPTLPQTSKGEPADQITCLDFSPDSQVLLVGTSGGSLSAWTMRNGARLWRISRFAGPITALACDGDGQFVAVAGSSPSIELVRIRTGERCVSLPVEGLRITAIAFSPLRSMLAVGSDEGWIRVFDVARLRLELAALGLAW